MDLSQISPTELFSKCLQSFRASLSEHDKLIFREFQTGEEMLQSLNEHLHATKHSKLDLYSRKLGAFTSSLTPYFDVISSFVQVKPEVLGGLWGSVLLVLKLGSNYHGFFEKMLQMLEDISTSLPQYGDAVDICRSRTFIIQDRLQKSLSLVYADIFEFCRQVLVMLNLGSRGSKWRHRVGFLGDVIWRPFDDRFRQLLERLARHKAVFEYEMRLQGQKMLNRIHQNQARLDILYENIQKALNEGFQEVKQFPDSFTMARFKKDLDQQTTLLKTWVGAAEYMNIYEHAKQNRMEGSGQWFLSIEEYRVWRSSSCSRPEGNNTTSAQHPSSLSERVLLLYAKPGFGKTYLSTTIIDDLKSYTSLTTANQDQRDQIPLLSFFHFSRDATLGSGLMAVDGLRAIAAQMVHGLRDEPAILDSVGVFMGLQSSGQITASYNDILTTLSLLAKVRPFFFVVDGVDECSDHENLLTILSNLCQSSECRLLTLSRPDIQLPRLLSRIPQRWCQLNESNNYNDIELYLTRNLRAMAEDGLFGAVPLSENSIHRAANQSSGVFLWTTLFASYVRNPALTPRERHQFITDALSFSGLDGLFKAILSRLDQRSPREKKLALTIFQWIAAALYPISSLTLHTALAITPGEETSDLDYLVGFPECLPKLTGSLVEINPFGRPSFIHLSVREFLVSQRSASIPSFSLKHPHLVHAKIAATCLSYLSHDVPRKPLRPLLRDTPILFKQPEQPEQVTQGTQTDATVLLRRPPSYFDRPNTTETILWELARAYGSPMARPIDAIVRQPTIEDPIIERDGLISDVGRQKMFIYTLGNFNTSYDDPMVQSQEQQQSNFPNQSQESLHPQTQAENGKQKIVVDDNEEDRSLSIGYPMLRYSALCWTQHLWLALDEKHKKYAMSSPSTVSRSSPRTQPGDHQNAQHVNIPLPLWAAHLSRFLLTRPCITNWVECSFAYHLQPTVARLKGAMESVAEDFDQKNSDGREIHWILHGLNQLDEALTELDERYGTVLRKNPSLIWQDTITAATDQHFWPVWPLEEPSCPMPLAGSCWDRENYEVPPITRTDVPPGSSPSKKRRLTSYTPN
ncbi:hypothetical protein F5Y12DRAFT_772567 [Xylaria sp. FL1777]|nr:hypothetical protein F5Y12DRAFT_772567 [Xylaria sp. FL1777]